MSTDGDPLEEAEARLLGEILTAANVDLTEAGIDNQELLEGRTQLTYEELGFVMKDNPTTRILWTHNGAGALSLELTVTLETPSNWYGGTTHCVYWYTSAHTLT